MTLYFNALGNNGHLGNQMFQYAALRGIASNKNFGWSIPPSYLFGTNYPLRSNIYKCFKLPSTGPENIGTGFLVNEVHERKHGFDPEIFNYINDNSNLNGYFQDERYFKKIKSEILTDFTFKDKIVEQASSIEYPNNAVSIHVRRTDYVNNPHHNSVTENYYRNAMEIFEGNPMFVFSDDPEWCKSQDIFKKCSVSINNEYIDLYLMTQSKYHIIANSSFSWWGAYLSQSDNVILPSKWFGPALEHLDTSGYYLKNWKTI